MAVHYFFDKEEEARLIESITQAELKTSGEIRIHIEKKALKPIMKRAVDVFEKLKMHQTELKNGVLFYLATEDHGFAILGDSGINEKVPENFWDDIKDKMQSYFKEGHFCQGLEEGISLAGDALAEYFPRAEDDINELPNDISASDQ